MYSPLEQFKIWPYYRQNNTYYDISISNISIYIIICSIISITWLYNNNKIIINKRKIQGIKILIEKYITQIQEVGGTYTIVYVPLIINIFIFILWNNLIGLIPYNVSTTSQIIINITLSLSIIIGITTLGLIKHSIYIYKLFIPSGLPKLIIPIIAIIEIISYLSRIISLAVRLTANMISGHSILHIISSFTIYLLKNSLTISLIFIPFIIILLLFFLELGVAIIQAYVFSILTLTYIKDILNIYH